VAAEESTQEVVGTGLTNTATPSSTSITSWIQDAVGGLARGELNEASSILLFKLVIPAAMAIVLLIVAYFTAKLVSRGIATALCKRVDETLGKFVGRLAFYGVMIVSSLGILSVAGVSVAGAAAMLTAAGFAIGLAFQGTLSNFAAGVLLLVFRPFKVGDMVVVGGVYGKVNEIDLFTTTIDTTDNRRLVIPNNSIVGTTIENVTFHDHRRVEVTVGVAYRADMDQTRQVLTAAAESLSDVMITGEGRGFQILLSNLSSSSVEWTIRFWAAKSNYWPVRERLIGAAKKHLDMNGIEIPFPQLHLHMDDPKMLEARRLATHQGTPVPQMTSTSEPATATKVRPRIRGDATHVA
jgi:small conductance mechanosensitive channel